MFIARISIGAGERGRGGGGVLGGGGALGWTGISTQVGGVTF